MSVWIVAAVFLVVFQAIYVLLLLSALEWPSLGKMLPHVSVFAVINLIMGIMVFLGT